MKSKRSLIAVILTICMIFSMVCSAAPIPVIVENASEIEAASIDAELQEAAEVMSAVVPGKNLLTGTTEAYTFDEGVVPTWLTSQFYTRNENLGSGYRVFLVADLNGGYNGDYYAVKIDVGSLDRPFYVSTSYRAVVDSTYPRSISAAYYRAVCADGTGAKINGDEKVTTTATNYTKREVISEGEDGAFRGTPENPVTSIELRVLHENGSGSKWKDYYDDIVVMPFYKVTYHDANGNVASTEYVDPRETSYTVASGNWTTTPDGTEKVTSITLNYEDIDLYPYEEQVVVNDVVPGKNLLTGTTDAYTFDVIGDPPSWIGGDGFYRSVRDLGAGYKVLLVADLNGGANGDYAAVRIDVGALDRPFYISTNYKAVVDETYPRSISAVYYRAMYDVAADSGEKISGETSVTTTATGYTKREVISKNDNGVFCGTPEKPVTAIEIRMLHQGGSGNKWKDYHDDYIVMPFYKVTYHDANGNVASTEYVDPRETSYTVASGNWTTTPDGTEKVTSITLNYEDIDLYPYEEQVVVNDVVPGKNLLTGTTDAYTFDAGIGTAYATSSKTPTAYSDNGNAVLKIAHTATWAHDNVGLWSGSVDRPVYISVMHKAATGALGSTCVFTICGENHSTTKTAVDGWTKLEVYSQKPSSSAPMTSLVVHATHAGEWEDYYDDLVIMPAYKVTYYDANGDVLETVYTDPRYDYTVKTDNVIAGFSGWTTTPDGTEKVTSVTLAYEDIELYPYEEPIAPGKNILTGTTEAYTFDAGIGTAYATSSKTPTAYSDGDNAVLKIAHTADWAHDNVGLWQGSIDRPVYISVMHKAATGALGSTCVFTICGENHSTTKTEVDGWTKLEVYSNLPSSSNPMTSLVVHATHAAAWEDYYDDLVIMPAYKVTYYDANGDVLETVYADPRYDYTVKTDNVIAGSSGWATVAGEAAQATIALEHEDIDLYPACEKLHSTNGASIRADVGGIRFRAGITPGYKADATVVAYGHIVSTEKHIANPEELTFATSAKYVYGVSYDVNTGRDAIYEIDDKYVYFTSVLVGMDLTKTVCETKYIVRPYVLMSDGSYVYGTPVSRSMLETANNIIASDKATEEDIAAAQRIIDACK